MMSRLTDAWRAWVDRPRDESSNSFAMFVLMLPLLMVSFGVGLDVSRNMYIRTTLQNGLDLAAVSGAGVTTIGEGGRVTIAEGADNTVRQVYAINRNTGPALNCWGPNTLVPGTSSRQCWREPRAPSIGRTNLTFTVRERSQNAFLPVVGIRWQTYTITSYARVNQQTQ